MKKMVAVLALNFMMGCTYGPPLNFQSPARESGPQTYAIIVCGPRVGYANGHKSDLTAQFGIVVQSAYRHLQEDLKIPQKHIFVLDSETDPLFVRYPVIGSASLDNFEEALNTLSTVIKPSDILIVHFACHGYKESVSLDGNRISPNDILSALKVVHGRIVLVNLDSCYAGSVAKRIGNRNVIAIAPCGEDNGEPLRGENTFSILVYKGFAAISADDNHDGKISVLEAYLWACSRRIVKYPEVHTDLDASRIFLR